MGESFRTIAFRWGNWYYRIISEIKQAQTIDLVEREMLMYELNNFDCQEVDKISSYFPSEICDLDSID